MGTHTISNTSTFHGWLESMGLDDILLNPCSCIFGEEEPPPPLPGQRGIGGARGRQGGGGGRGQTGRATKSAAANAADEEEPQSRFPFGALFGSSNSR